MSPPSAEALRADPFYPRLKAHLIAATGLAYYADKDADLAAKLARRLAARGLRDCTAYLAALADGEAGAAELDALIEDLTIGETFFFRHREMFEALRAVVLPDLLERRRYARQLRVWSAGCSTGAEPYSLAVLLRREFAGPLAGWDVNILGTDVNRRFLGRAREGLFEEWALRNTPAEVRDACFTRAGTSWRLAAEYRRGVAFQYHNLVAHPFPSLPNNLFAFDLILCRNVTIYFGPEVVRRLVGQFHDCLVEGGWLSVGHAEPNTETFRAYRTVNAAGAVLYQKAAAGGPAAPAPPLPASAPFAAWQPPVLPEQVEAFVRKAAPAPAPPPAPAGAAADLAAVRALADGGQWEDAARACLDLLAHDKLNPAAYFYHGLVLEQLGRHDEAERALKQALYLDRRFALAHYYLGLLAQKLGQPRQAARAFENVLRLVAGLDAGKVFAEGDGITAGELRNLARMNLDVLEGA